MGGTGGEWSRLPPGTAAGAAGPRWGVERDLACALLLPGGRAPGRQGPRLPPPLAEAPGSVKRPLAPRPGRAPLGASVTAAPWAWPCGSSRPGPVCFPPEPQREETETLLQPVGLSSLGPDTWGPHDAWSVAQVACRRTIKRGKAGQPGPAPGCPAAPSLSRPGGRVMGQKALPLARPSLPPGHLNPTPTATSASGSE